MDEKLDSNGILKIMEEPFPLQEEIARLAFNGMRLSYGLPDVATISQAPGRQSYRLAAIEILNLLTPNPSPNGGRGSRDALIQVANDLVNQNPPEDASDDFKLGWTQASTQAQTKMLDSIEESYQINVYAVIAAELTTLVRQAMEHMTEEERFAWQQKAAKILLSKHHLPHGFKLWGPDSPDYPNPPSDWKGGAWMNRAGKVIEGHIPTREKDRPTPGIWSHFGGYTDSGRMAGHHDVIAYEFDPSIEQKETKNDG